jgi:hypothetical protein
MIGEAKKASRRDGADKPMEHNDSCLTKKYNSKTFAPRKVECKQTSVIAIHDD